VRKRLKAPVAGGPKYRRDPRPGKLTAFHEALQLALKVDGHRPKRERRAAHALYAEIKAAGYAGGYTRVTDFVRAWRQGAGQAGSTTTFVPLAFELGEAFQFDWSEEGLVVGGIYYRMQVVLPPQLAEGLGGAAHGPSQRVRRGTAFRPSPKSIPASPS